MKKIPLIQIISGILLIASYFVYTSLVQPGYSKMEILDIDGNIIGYWQISSLLKPNPLREIWILAYPTLGILMTGCGIARLVRIFQSSISRRLDIAQVISGVLALTLMIIFITSVEPPWQNYLPAVENQGIPEAVTIRHNPGWIALMTAWKVVFFSLGPLLTTSGIWQLRKSRIAEG